MATQYDDKQTFDADADRIMGMFSEQSYFEKKYAQTTKGFEILECEKSDSKFRIKARLQMAADAPVPGFAKKFIADTMTVVQEDTWDLDSRTGRLDIEISGAPVTISADMELVSEGEGAANKMRWTVNCKVPLVGGKLEKMMLDDIRSKAPRDLEVSRSLVADY